MTGRIEILAVAGLPEVRPGDHLAALIAGAAHLVALDAPAAVAAIVRNDSG